MFGEVGVLIIDEMVSEEGQIEAPTPDLVRKEPLKVAGNFEFVDIDMNNDIEVEPQSSNFPNLQGPRGL